MRRRPPLAKRLRRYWYGVLFRADTWEWRGWGGEGRGGGRGRSRESGRAIIESHCCLKKLI